MEAVELIVGGMTYKPALHKAGLQCARGTPAYRHVRYLVQKATDVRKKKIRKKILKNVEVKTASLQQFRRERNETKEAAEAALRKCDAAVKR